MAKIALEQRLKKAGSVVTLGVRPNFSDYTRQEAEMIRSAEMIYYPSTFYADLFDAMGKRMFPSYHTYKCVQDKIKQTALFNLLEVPHPRTRVFYGKRQKAGILSDFEFPFVAKIPRGSALGKGVFLIENQADLTRYLELGGPAYIQEFIETAVEVKQEVNREVKSIAACEDVRVVVIGSKVATAYRRRAQAGEFRSNVSAGGGICFDCVPEEAIELGLETAKKCQWDDVGIDVIKGRSGYMVLEGNMKYGRKGFAKAGVDYHEMMAAMIERGDI